MQYSDLTARTLIARYGLNPSVRRYWKRQGAIPDHYADPHYERPKPLTAAERAQQERMLTVLQHPLLLHHAFDALTDARHKLREMLALRYQRAAGKVRMGRRATPLLHLHPHELARLRQAMKGLRVAIEGLLLRLSSLPYEARQQQLRLFIRQHAELTARQCAIELSTTVARRWESFCCGRIKRLREDEEWVVAHVEQKLAGLAAALAETLHPKAR